MQYIVQYEGSIGLCTHTHTHKYIYHHSYRPGGPGPISRVEMGPRYLADPSCSHPDISSQIWTGEGPPMAKQCQHGCLALVEKTKLMEKKISLIMDCLKMNLVLMNV